MYVHTYDINDLKALFVAFDVLFTVLMFGGVGALLHHSYPNGPHGARRSSEENLLFKKFANGKIDDDEYRRRREALRSSADAAHCAVIDSWDVPGNHLDGQSPPVTGSVFGCGGVTVRAVARSSESRAAAHAPGSPPRFSASSEDLASDVQSLSSMSVANLSVTLGIALSGNPRLNIQEGTEASRHLLEFLPGRGRLNVE